MLTKEQVIESIQNMPEEVFEDINVLLERIVILEKIEKAEKDITDERVFSTKEARENLSKWLK